MALALYLVIRRRAHGRAVLVAGGLAATGALLIGVGAIELPNVEHIIEEAGKTLGKWTYLAVGVMAFLETGAFIGLVAPGRDDGDRRRPRRRAGRDLADGPDRDRVDLRGRSATSRPTRSGAGSAASSWSATARG